MLASVAQFCRREGLRFAPYPMHEVLGHPDAPNLLRIFAQYAPNLFEPLPTPGPALSTRRDRDTLLDGIKSVGTKTLWFTFHGMKDAHNQVVHHKDAFDATCQAVKLGKEAGFRCGANIFVTRESAPQIPALVDLAATIGLDECCFEVTRYHPIPRLRRYEAVRPELAELTPYVDAVRQHSHFWRDKWGNLSRHTESHYVKAARNPPTDPGLRWSYLVESCIRLVCRNNLDLHAGNPGAYGPLYGNLGGQEVEEILGRAVDAGPQPDEKLYFPALEIPPLADLAMRHGDPNSQRIYFSGAEMRLRWLDLANGSKGP